MSPAYRASELTVSGKCGNYTGEALQANCVRAGEKFRGLQAGVEGVEAGAAGEERLVEVLIVYGHRLHKCTAQVHRGHLKLN